MMFHYKTGIYSSSKAALNMASDIWRREFEPLGVRTMTLITTSVKTPAFERIEKPQIPQSSYYYVIHEYIESLADGRLQEGAPDPRTYALKVVAAIEKGTTGDFWVGKDATVNRWSFKLLPKSLFVSFRYNYLVFAFDKELTMMIQDSVIDGFLKVSGELAKVAQAMNTKK
jgi:1-acylglycerone phosphate reductase